MLHVAAKMQKCSVCDPKPALSSTTGLVTAESMNTDEALYIYIKNIMDHQRVPHKQNFWLE